MKAANERLGPAAERFLRQVLQIDHLRAELEEFEHFEAAAVPRLLESIEASRSAVRDAQRTMREIRAERRRRERQLVRLRRSSGLEQAQEPPPSRPGKQRHPGAALLAGKEVLRQLSELRESTAIQRMQLHAGLRSSRYTIESAHSLLR